jgi:heat shock protein HslJ
MPDEPGPDIPEEDGKAGGAGPKGFMVPIVILLFGILIVMIVFMNLTGQNATASGAITETPWQLESMTDYYGNTTPVLNGTVLTAQFALDGKLTGTGGCNGYSGRYLVKETKIVISRVDHTSMACLDTAANLQESLYFGDLEDAAALRVHERSLTLYDSEGKLRLNFVPAQAGI